MPQTTYISKTEFISIFFSNLDNMKIDYFVFGEYQSLPYSTNGSDIDIIVTQNDAHTLIKTIAEITQKYNVVLASMYCNSKVLMLRMITADWGLQLDVLIGGLFYRNKEYYPLTTLQKHVIRHNGIRVLEYNFSNYVGFFKEIIHNGYAKHKYLNAFWLAKENKKEDVRHDIESVYSTKVWETIEMSTSREELNQKGKIIQRVILYSLGKQVWWQSIGYYAQRMKRLLQPKPGYVVVVEGTDGSGKSTVIDTLTPWLNDCFHNTVVYNHLRPHMLPDIAVVLGKRKSDMKVDVVDNPHAGKESGFIGSLMRWMYYLHDYTWGYLYKVFLKIKVRSYLYIFDRYYYDYYIDSKRSLTSLPRWILRFGELFVPKPDVILCLGGEPEKIYARKPETSLEEVARQTEELKRFASRRNNAVWIDTTQPIENSVRDAKSAILNMMSTRFKDVL